MGANTTRVEVCIIVVNGRSSSERRHSGFVNLRGEIEAPSGSRQPQYYLLSTLAEIS